MRRKRNGLLRNFMSFGSDFVCPHVTACPHEPCFFNVFVQTSRWAHPIPLVQPPAVPPQLTKPNKNRSFSLNQTGCLHLRPCIQMPLMEICRQISGETTGLLALIIFYGWMMMNGAYILSYLYMSWWAPGVMWICTFLNLMKFDKTWSRSAILLSEQTNGWWKSWEI